ncbi:MAG: alpha/beta fold hydrolase, partial [Acidobacteria bacterium]|nr:alpha/beta fold hydrolase [Acidobacteriota bacterium]
MKILLRQFAFVLLFGSLSVSIASAQKAIVGNWEGAAVRQNAELPLEMEFKGGEKGLTGSLTIRSLGGLEIPLKTVSYQSPDLKFELQTDAGNVVFNGTLSKNSLIGTWNLFGFESQVSLKRAAAKPKPYTQEEIRCQNGDVTLAGTLLIPKTKNRHPALVFLHGSGATKRDVNRFLADHFARKGVAALIFDKRGTGSSTGNWRQSDFNDLARDAASCVEILKNRKDINKRQIGLIGASQSGWVAPLVLSMSPDVAFMINVSGTFI